MKCGNCGAEIPETANFCRFCGTAKEVIPVSDSDETEAENAPVSEQLDNSDQLRAAIFTLQNQVSLLTSRLAALEQSLAGSQSSEPQRPPPSYCSPADRSDPGKAGSTVGGPGLSHAFGAPVRRTWAGWRRNSRTPQSYRRRACQCASGYPTDKQRRSRPNHCPIP